MNTNYYQKYLKYKTKYLNLKSLNRQKGGYLHKGAGQIIFKTSKLYRTVDNPQNLWGNGTRVNMSTPFTSQSDNLIDLAVQSVNYKPIETWYEAGNNYLFELRPIKPVPVKYGLYAGKVEAILAEDFLTVTTIWVDDELKGHDIQPLIELYPGAKIIFTDVKSDRKAEIVDDGPIKGIVMSFDSTDNPDGGILIPPEMVKDWTEYYIEVANKLLQTEQHISHQSNPKDLLREYKEQVIGELTEYDDYDYNTRDIIDTTFAKSARKR